MKNVLPESDLIQASRLKRVVHLSFVLKSLNAGVGWESTLENQTGIRGFSQQKREDFFFFFLDLSTRKKH